MTAEVASSSLVLHPTLPYRLVVGLQTLNLAGGVRVPVGHPLQTLLHYEAAFGVGRSSNLSFAHCQVTWYWSPAIVLSGISMCHDCCGIVTTIDWCCVVTMVISVTGCAVEMLAIRGLVLAESRVWIAIHWVVGKTRHCLAILSMFCFSLG